MDGLQLPSLNLGLDDRALCADRRDPQGSELPRLAWLGISFRRQGLGRYRPVRSSSRSFARKASLPSPLRILGTVIPSIPAVRLPLLPAILRQAHRKLRRSVTQFHNSR